MVTMVSKQLKTKLSLFKIFREYKNVLYLPFLLLTSNDSYAPLSKLAFYDLKFDPLLVGNQDAATSFA